MNKKLLCSGVMAMLAITPLYADPPKGFEEFRKGLLSDFNSFRSRILDHYADFLAGEWHEYEALEGTSKYTEPKFQSMPVMEVSELDIQEGENQKKEMLATFGFLGTGSAASTSAKTLKHNDFIERIKHTLNLYNAPADSLSQSTSDANSKAGGNIMTPNGLRSDYDGDVFDFYTMKFALPTIEFNLSPTVSVVGDFANHWKELEEQKVAERLIPSLTQLQKASGISDYHLFELIMAYADHKFPDANDAAKMSFTHHILTNMEFGIRIALDNNGQPFMLIPFDEYVYNCTNAVISDIRYYFFSTPGRQHVQRMGFNTPPLPAGGDLGKPMHLRMDGLTLPYEPMEYSYEYGGLKLEGEINKNIAPMFFKYPQMDTQGFAASIISKGVRDDVVAQVKKQLNSGDPIRDADKLLSMIQFAFPYATDDEMYGFEKPYFFEESLLYPTSDCEDRAVFYSYILWNALGLETDLIAYPNHEAAAIKAEKVWGGDMHYKRNNAKYFISDPTFQGAPTGNGMSRFKDTDPKVDLSYSKSE